MRYGDGRRDGLGNRLYSVLSPSGIMSLLVARASSHRSFIIPLRMPKFASRVHDGNAIVAPQEFDQIGIGVYIVRLPQKAVGEPQGVGPREGRSKTRSVLQEFLEEIGNFPLETDQVIPPSALGRGAGLFQPRSEGG